MQSKPKKGKECLETNLQSREKKKHDIVKHNEAKENKLVTLNVTNLISMLSLGFRLVPC